MQNNLRQNLANSILNGESSVFEVASNLRYDVYSKMAVSPHTKTFQDDFISLAFLVYAVTQVMASKVKFPEFEFDFDSQEDFTEFSFYLFEGAGDDEPTVKFEEANNLLIETLVAISINGKYEITYDESEDFKVIIKFYNFDTNNYNLTVEQP